MATGILVELNGLEFEIPTKSEHNWSELTDWILEVNETLENSSENFNIPAGTANLSNGVAVNLYTINNPSDNANIIFEYGITRITTGGGATSLTETGSLELAYNSATGNWTYANYGIGDAQVAVAVSASNIIQATATALTGTPSVSKISYRGRIIRT